VRLYDPTAPRRDDPGRALARLDTLAGKVVGFIDNAKPNFNHLVDDLAERLVADYGVKRVVKRRKTSASIPAPDEIVRELADECDLVITGSGD
jgi:ABC-type transporter Mla subunit MlaD